MERKDGYKATESSGLCTARTAVPSYTASHSFPSNQGAIVVRVDRKLNMLAVAVAVARVPPRQLIRGFSSSAGKFEYFRNVDQKVLERERAGLLDSSLIASSGVRKGASSEGQDCHSRLPCRVRVFIRAE